MANRPCLQALPGKGKLNGSQVLTNFDILAAADGKNSAVAEFTTMADSNGTITIQFITSKDNAMVNGIEIYAN